MTATAAAVAFIVFSCKGKLSEAEHIDLGATPLQTVEDMFFVQTENGKLKVRVEAPIMESYDNDSLTYEVFPEGLQVFGYSEDGLLETTIRSDRARHDKAKKKDGEIWKAVGNVVVKNVTKQEIMETDTIPRPDSCRGTGCGRTRWRGTPSSGALSTVGERWATTVRSS